MFSFGVVQAIEAYFRFLLFFLFRNKLLIRYVVNNIIADLHMENICELVRARISRK